MAANNGVGPLYNPAVIKKYIYIYTNDPTAPSTTYTDHPCGLIFIIFSIECFGGVRKVVRGPSPLDCSTDRGSVFSGHPSSLQHQKCLPISESPGAYIIYMLLESPSVNPSFPGILIKLSDFFILSQTKLVENRDLHSSTYP